MSWRKSESPVVFALLGTMLLLVGFTAGLPYGAKLRECPAEEDGRPLIGRDLTHNTCKYAALPRVMAALSSEELMRMGRAKKRMEDIDNPPKKRRLAR
jgi:hypothetical protein